MIEWQNLVVLHVSSSSQPILQYILKKPVGEINKICKTLPVCFVHKTKWWSWENWIELHTLVAHRDLSYSYNAY